MEGMDGIDGQKEGKHKESPESSLLFVFLFETLSTKEKKETNKGW